MDSLRKVLHDLTVDTAMVGKPDEAARLLSQIRPDVIFTDTVWPHGSWVDVVKTSHRAKHPARVVVVHPTGNIELYVTAMENGAFDFVVPPFEHEGLAHIIRSAQLTDNYKT